VSTYTKILYHIVFSTKDRARALDTDRRDELFRYIWGLLKNKDCHLYRIGGVEDHVHLLTGLHPTICLSDLVKDIKTSTTHWAKEHRCFPGFRGWQDGYGAFTVSDGGKDAVIEYIKGQPEHHRQASFAEEFRALLVKHGIQFDERYLC
jgi:putative transposase